MRNLPLLLTLLLLSVLLAATSAQASPLPLLDRTLSFVALADEEEEAEAAEAEGEEAELDEEFCDPEIEEFCEEEEAEDRGRGASEDDECLLKNARAAVTANPGKRQLRLTVHYRTLKPTTVSVEASLQGAKGAVHLGTSHARFRRSGVYRDTFALAEKQMKRALAAREFSVELHVVNAPPACAVELTGASPRAKR